MNTALWIATGLLTAVALVGGLSKTLVPKEKLGSLEAGRWTRSASVPFVKTLGSLELLAAAGLTLPALFGVATFMVPVTALCWVALMVGAMVTHGRLAQPKVMAVNAVYLGLAAFIAWGRIWPAPL